MRCLIRRRAFRTSLAPLAGCQEKCISHHTKVHDFLIRVSALPLHQFVALLFRRQSQIFSSCSVHAFAHHHLPHCIIPRTPACWRIACGGLIVYIRFYYHLCPPDIDWSLLRKSVARVVPFSFFHLLLLPPDCPRLDAHALQCRLCI